ncbi:MAG: hypothetical protein CMO01_23945 [Thalassobius sp.]|nr:hypothetical protein [Thalassovita sp.]
MNYARLLIAMLLLFSCNETQEDIIIDAQLGDVFYDEFKNEVLIEGDISAATLYSVEGSKVKVQDIDILKFGHAIFDASTAEELPVSLDNTSATTEFTSTDDKTFISTFDNLSSNATYYVRTYIETADGGFNFSNEASFTPSNETKVNYWDRQSISFEGQARVNVVGFGVGDLAFVGTGYTASFFSSTNYKDLWQYDTGAGSWSVVNSVPENFSGRHQATAFSIENDAFIGLGINSSGYTTNLSSVSSLNDLWKFTPSSDSWSELTPYPGESTASLAIAVTNGKAYLGLGKKYGTDGNSELINEFYEFDPSSNSWNQKADFPYDLREGGVTFAIGNKVYYGFGRSETDGPFIGEGYTYYSDFYEYDTESNSWTQLTDVSNELRRADAGGFSVAGNGYIIGGYNTVSSTINEFNDLLKYNPVEDSWEEIAQYPGDARHSPAIAVLDDRVLVGTGSYRTSVYSSSSTPISSIYFYYPFLADN